MKRFYRLIFALALAFALPCAAIAADSAKPAPTPAAAQSADPSPDYSPILKIFQTQGVILNYLGRQYGLDGWLLTKDAKIQVVYVTPDGKGAVIGTMYGPDGNLITGSQLAAAKGKNLLPANPNASALTPAMAASAPAATATSDASAGSSDAPPPGVIAAQKNGEVPSERLWKQVEASTYIKFGPDTAPPFYVIMDPRCEYCQKLYNDLTQKYLPNNGLQLRVIPVGILGDASVKEADQVISVPADSANHWIEIEHHNIGNLPPAASDANEKIAKNHDIMEDWNLSGTPSCVYRSKDGKVKVVLGVPHDLDAVMADLGPGKS